MSVVSTEKKWVKFFPCICFIATVCIQRVGPECWHVTAMLQLSKHGNPNEATALMAERIYDKWPTL